MRLSVRFTTVIVGLPMRFSVQGLNFQYENRNRDKNKITTYKGTVSMQALTTVIRFS